MPQKRATFYTNGDDNVCSEIKSFIEDGGYLLNIRDINKNPLTASELADLIGYIDTKHFLNSLSNGYKENKLDQNNPNRTELFKILAGDNSILKMPIIRTARLLTVGCNRDKISQMLQISSNGSDPKQMNNLGNVKDNNYKKKQTKKTTQASK